MVKAIEIECNAIHEVKYNCDATKEAVNFISAGIELA